MFKTALTVAAFATVATSVQAEPQRALRTARVAYGDLDLASPDGARALMHRLRVAAKGLCVDLHTPVLMGESGRVDRCRRQAVTTAVERLNRPQLTLVLAEMPDAP